MTEALSVQLTEEGSDPERLDELTSRLRQELLQLPVDNVEKVSEGTAPEGTRGLEIAAIGALLVTLQQSGPAISGVINTIREWLKRDPEPTRAVKITLGDRTIDLTAASSEQQDQLVAEFIRASAAAAGGT
jgi:membrane-associated two-gene conflict system component 1 (EACC1)